MAHIIETVENESFGTSVEQLLAAHAFVVSRAVAVQAEIGTNLDHWGMLAKRKSVDLRGGPRLVGKSEEKLVELINILATTERTIEALQWLSLTHSGLIVRECHASTSDNTDGNDIVLVDSEGFVKVKCEVCDVVSNNAGSNGKEKRDIKNLGCADFVPRDGLVRYIATSSEFAAALTNRNRNWLTMHYQYKVIRTGLPQDTVMLVVLPCDE